MPDAQVDSSRVAEGVRGADELADRVFRASGVERVDGEGRVRENEEAPRVGGRLERPDDHGEDGEGLCVVDAGKLGLDAAVKRVSRVKVRRVVLRPETESGRDAVVRDEAGVAVDQSVCVPFLPVLECRVEEVQRRGDEELVGEPLEVAPHGLVVRYLELLFRFAADLVAERVDRKARERERRERPVRPADDLPVREERGGGLGKEGGDGGAKGVDGGGRDGGRVGLDRDEVAEDDELGRARDLLLTRPREPNVRPAEQDLGLGKRHLARLAGRRVRDEHGDTAHVDGEDVVDENAEIGGVEVVVNRPE